MTTVKNDGQLNVRLPEEVLASLLKIEAKHGPTPNEILRKLAAGAAAFFDEHDWFTSPVIITPEQFQNQKAASANKAEETAAAAIVNTKQKHSPARTKLKTVRDGRITATVSTTPPGIIPAVDEIRGKRAKRSGSGREKI